MLSLGRILSCICVFGLLAWLALDPSPSATSWDGLQRAFDAGDIGIGTLPGPQQAALRATVDWLAPYAKVQGEIAINERPKPGRLNVITTTSKAVALTGCASGNAVYDSKLDTIFIDEHIAWPRDLLLIGAHGPRTMFTEDTLGFPVVYLRFVLLHELGHRFLHHRNNGFFDASKGERAEEESADIFAVRALNEAYREDQRIGVSHRQSNAGVKLNIAGETPRPEERAWVDLMSASASMSVALMYSASEFSSFYQDSAHPNFFDRADRIFSLASNAAEVSEALKANAAFYRESLARTRILLSLKIQELQLQESVQNVTFYNRGVLVLANHGDLFATTIARASRCCNVSRLSASHLVARGPFPDVDDESADSSLWASDESGPTVFRADLSREDKTMVAVRPDGNGGFKEIESLKQMHNQSTFGESLVLPPQPSPTVLLGRKTRDEGDYWIVKESRLIAVGSWRAIRDDIRNRLRLPSAEIEVGTMTNNVLYLTVSDSGGSADKHEQLRGVAELDLL